MAAKAAQRNAPCPCGSGRKFKRCCAARVRRREVRNAKLARFVAAALVLGALVAIVALFRSVDPDATPPGRVWSAAHGHWHDAP